MPKRRKLTDLLRGLPLDERADFQAFLRSPFFIKNDAPALFFERLCERYPLHFEQDDYDWKAVFIKAFPRREFNAHKLDTLLPTLARLLEHFFSMREAFPGGFSEQVHKPPPSPSGKKSRGDHPPAPAAERQVRNLQSRALGKRNLSPLFQLETASLIADLEGDPLKDANDYLSLHQLHHHLYFHPDTPKYGAAAPNLESAMENLDLHYFLNKLRYFVEAQTREKLFGVSHEVRLVDEVLAATADPALVESHLLIALYHKLVWLFRNDAGESSFRELQALFLKKFDFLPSAEQGILSHQLLNYGIYLTERHCQVEAALLALYKKQIEAGMLLSGDRLTDSTFTNIVFVAAGCGEFEWAEAFMPDYATRLEEGIRPHAVALATAWLFYARGLLDKAHDWVNLVDVPNMSYALRKKVLLSKITFDQYVQQGMNYDYLHSHLDAFEKYVKGRELREDRKLAFLNFIRFARRMAKLKFTEVTVKEPYKISLRRSLAQLPQVVCKNWLAQKIEEL